MQGSASHSETQTTKRMTKPSPVDCAEALRLMSAYLDNELNGVDRNIVALHLSTCKSCFSRAEFERELARHLRQLGRSDVRQEFEQRIRLLVSDFASAPADTQNID